MLSIEASLGSKLSKMRTLRQMRREYCSRKKTYGIMIGLEHLYIIIIRKAVLADGGEVGGFPPRSIEILLDLRRHDETVRRFPRIFESEGWRSVFVFLSSSLLAVALRRRKADEVLEASEILVITFGVQVGLALSARDEAASVAGGIQGS